jgi:hypothetical protein
MDKNFRFQLVEKKDEHIRLLFELLNDRQFSISHKIQPSYLEHEIFVRSDPYRAWYLVFCGEKMAGSFYLTNDNYIGLNFRDQDAVTIHSVLTYIVKRYTPLPAIPSLVPCHFSVNVAYANDDLITILRQFGCQQIQTTFQLG